MSDKRKCDSCKLPYADSMCTSQLETIEHNYIWTIKNFSSLISKEINKIESEDVSMLNAPIFAWKLVLKIGSRKYENIRIEVVPAMLCSNHQKVYLKATISILNIISGKKHATVTLKDSVAEYEILCFPNFISKTSLMQNADGLLPNDSLTILCEFSQTGMTRSLLEGDKLNCLTMPKRRKITYDKKNVKQAKQDIVFGNQDQVLQDYSKLFENPVFTDAIILVSETSFKVHKAVISTRCPVFWAMFKNNMKEQRTSTVKITDISPNIFRELLRFIYCGEVNNIENIAWKLIIAADKYAMDDLKSMCEKTMSDALSTQNAMEFLSIAEQLRIQHLKKKVLLFIKENLPKVAKQNNLDAFGFAAEIVQMLIPE